MGVLILLFYFTMYDAISCFCQQFIIGKNVCRLMFYEL